MKRSDLVTRLAAQPSDLDREDVAVAVAALFELMRESLARGERIEVRDFGTFSVRERKARLGRNPRTGESVAIPARRRVHFRMGKAMRERVAAERSPA